MLAKKNRLTGKTNFERVEKEGVIFQSANFGLAKYERSDEEPSRFAFIISTKIAKNATDRNTLKRHLREAVRQSIGEVKSGFDVVFLAKTSITRVPASEIMKEVRVAMREGEIFK